ncbi:hypothetical protein F4561_004155 [Lipingzhangella halophila]|uniref:Uncharacterized protein n=1 Tax=Lipingzhangella halophila TaxID=1783352 RepID=A0A7W7RJZ5_9ACTN|nr:hypothetical protein [Lipingzhangella halophila]MBB4933335.1 hypothetical protein [Lipingzhangella halophila]
MSEHAPDPGSASESTAPDPAEPARWSVRRRLQVGGGAIGLVAIVVAVVLMRPPSAYADIADCGELFTEELLTEVHLEEPGVSVEENDPPGPGLGSEQNRYCVDAELGQFTADIYFHSPDTRSDRYEELQERITENRGRAEGSAALDEQDRLAELDDPPRYVATEIEDIDAGEGGFAAVYEAQEEPDTPSLDTGEAEAVSTFARAEFRTRNIYVRISYLEASDERRGSSMLGTITVTRLAEALEARIDETSTKDSV